MGLKYLDNVELGVPSWGVSLVAQSVKNPPANAGKRRETRDEAGIPGWVRLPGEGNGNPLQYPRLENPMGRGAWQATVPRGLKESNSTECACYTTPRALLNSHFLMLTILF